jgi:RNA polymerase sigma-70 factor (ECF subfamily)
MPGCLGLVRVCRPHSSDQGFARKYDQDADAADLTQDVLQLVAAAFKGQQYDASRGSFRGWLYTVVRNQVRKLLGRRRPHHHGAGGTDAQVRLEQQLSPERDESAEWNADYQTDVLMPRPRCGRISTRPPGGRSGHLVEGRPARKSPPNLD